MTLNSFHLLGFDYKTLPIDLRQQVSFLKKEINPAYEVLLKKKILKDVVILSTCNRVEFYGIAESKTEFVTIIQDFLFEKISDNDKKKDLQKSISCFYYFEKLQALNHLYRVVSSLESLVIGENQILGQVKTAHFDRADLKIFRDKTLKKIFDTAIALGREVRRETNIGKGKVSIASVTIDLVKKIYSVEKSITFCIIGAGEINQDIFEYLKDFDFVEVFLINRSLENAKLLSEKYSSQKIKISVFSLQEIYSVINNSDVVITSTEAGKFLIKKKELEKELERKEQESKTNCQLLIDLSIPLNIEPTVNDLPSVIYYNVDQLNVIISNNKKLREKEIKDVEKIIKEEIQKTIVWQIYSYLNENFKNSILERSKLKKEIFSFFSFLSLANNLNIVEKIVDDFIREK